MSVHALFEGDNQMLTLPPVAELEHALLRQEKVSMICMLEARDTNLECGVYFQAPRFLEH